MLWLLFIIRIPSGLSRYDNFTTGLSLWYLKAITDFAIGANENRIVPANLLASRFMNILIENAETLEYLTTTGLWTKNAEKGKCFGITTAAFAAAKLEPIGKFNIVSYIAQTKQFINLDHGRGLG
jgi:hypothetical protein